MSFSGPYGATLKITRKPYVRDTTPEDLYRLHANVLRFRTDYKNQTDTTPNVDVPLARIEDLIVRLRLLPREEYSVLRFFVPPALPDAAAALPGLVLVYTAVVTRAIQLARLNTLYTNPTPVTADWDGVVGA